jgi:gliding motility-associated-like protein
MVKAKAIGLWLGCMLFGIASFATHNRAGEITYEHVGGFTYRVRITTYTKQSAIADRNSLKIRWGDEGPNTTENDLDSLFRTNQVLDVGIDVKRNEYSGLHTYSGPGTFVISVEDPNRNAGVLNINNGDPGTPEAEKTSTSVMAVFAIRSVLVIRPGNGGHNNSIKFLNPPIQDACIYQPWIHNPVAFDSLEGDQLVFSLVSCLGLNAEPLDAWESPNDYTDDPTDVFSINAENGDITWDTPLVAGEYNVAFEVKEYRQGLFVGSVQRDMQITVVTCANVPPEIAELPDYCIGAGELLQFQLNYSDPNGSAFQIDIDALGGPMTDVEHVAIYDDLSRFFSWNPQCAEVRSEPYFVSFLATDQGNIPLTDVETVSIQVVAPAVENPLAEAVGNQMNLSWNLTPCFSAFDPGELQDVRYLIYRRNGLFGFEPDNCELGVPEYTGYSLIGETEGASSNSYVDSSVFYGGVYCYMVVTVWPDGAVSYASEEFCDTVNKEVPVMTKVSIGITDLLTGVDTVHWSKPTDLDTALFPGPYVYALFHGANGNTANEVVYISPVFSALEDGDTTFIHTELNTFEYGHRYRVEIQSQSTAQTAQSATAASIHLGLIPGDNSVTLNMGADVPWANYRYHIYRKDPGASEFVEVGVSTFYLYTDSNLVNNELYCYRIKAIGSYYADDVPDPLENWSQEACATPYDQTPPCPPVLSIEDDCITGVNTLTWQNVAGCADDIRGYVVYYAPTLLDSLTVIYTSYDAEDTSFIFDGNERNNPASIAGCYVVTAIDSLNLWPDGNFYSNESAFSNVVCIDNCPEYSLPSIFSPNADQLNDIFKPFPYRYVKEIDLKIYNRWGGIVFETKDPAIGWDGKNKESETLCTDGIYYYVIRVDFIRLSGIISESYSGSVRLQSGSPIPASN